jgi:hypothetical protein
MITVGMNYHVIEGKQTLFEEKFAAVLSALKAAKGHTSSNLWKDVADGASYMITSEWSGRRAIVRTAEESTTLSFARPVRRGYRQRRSCGGNPDLGRRRTCPSRLGRPSG